MKFKIQGYQTDAEENTMAVFTGQPPLRFNSLKIWRTMGKSLTLWWTRNRKA